MIGLLMLVGEVVRGSIVSSGPAVPKTGSKAGQFGRRIRGPWSGSVVRSSRPANGERR